MDEGWRDDWDDEEIWNTITRFLSSIFGIPFDDRNAMRRRNVIRPLKHVLEKEKEYVVYYDFPGRKKDDFLINLSGNKLMLYVKGLDFRDVIAFKKRVKKVKSIDYRHGILEIVIEKK